MNNVGSELEWLYYHLWTKTGSQAPKFMFSIPDTVFYRNGRPDSWYFTSKDGYILKKNKFNVNQKVIHQKFTKRMQASDLVAATAYHYRKDTPFIDLYMEHIAISDFRTFMFYQEHLEKPSALQKFVLCKQARNSMIKCHWSPQMAIVEKQTNVNNLFDQKLPLEERIPTFEGQAHIAKSENIVPNQTIDEVNLAMKQIVEAMQTHSKTQLLGGNFYFKYGKDNNLVLLFATNIKTDKVEMLTHDNIEMRLKFWVSFNQKAFDDLPAVQAPKNGQQSSGSRPASHYGRQALGSRLKSQECPFCEVVFTQNEGSEVTLHQIIKLFSYYEEHEEILLELAQVPSLASDSVNGTTLQGGNQNFQRSLSNSKGLIPQPVLKLFPGMTLEKYQQKKNDPLFLYENVRVCENCYKYVKLLISHINQEQDDKKSAIGGGSSLASSMPQTFVMSKNVQFIKSQTESVNSEQFMQPYLHKQSLKKGGIPQPPVRGAGTASTTTGESKKSLVRQNKPPMMQRTASAKGCISERIIFNSARQSDVSVQSSQPLTMMFSKVEAGKEVAAIMKTQNKDSEGFDIKEERFLNQNKAEPEFETYYEKDRPMGAALKNRLTDHSFQSEQQQQENRASGARKDKTRAGEFKIYNRPKTHKETLSKRPSQPQKLLPKIDWEKEYHQAVKIKTKKAKDDILDACEKIESGQYTNAQTTAVGNSDSLDMKIQSDDINFNQIRSRMNAQKQALSYMEQRSLTNFGSQVYQQNYNGLMSAQGSEVMRDSRILDNVNEIEYEYQKQQMNAVTVGKIQKRPLESQSEHHSRFNSTKLVPEQQQNFKNMKENITKAYQPKLPVSQKRIRPMSSKPPLNSQNQQINIDIDWNVKSSAQLLQQYQLHSGNKARQNDSSSKKKRNKSAERTASQKKSGLTMAVQQKKDEAGGKSGFFDFQNMTENDIKQIADNADQLIHIIQNIKDTVSAPGGNIQENKGPRTVVDINEPCFEVDDEEDCTYELIESDRRKIDSEMAPNDSGWWK